MEAMNIEPIDPTDDLMRVIRTLCLRHDQAHEEIDPDAVLREIRDEHPDALLRRGQALALKACRRLITGHLKRMSALDPDEDAPQQEFPGIERMPTHIMFERPSGLHSTKIVARQTIDATRAQHESCLALKQINTQRCIEREGDQQKIIDLLASTGCNTLREWQERYGDKAA